jgi:hypothetical protein
MPSFAISSTRTRSLAAPAAFLILPALAGCATFGAVPDKGAKGQAEAERTVGANIPEIDPELRKPCPSPALEDGENPYGALARIGGQLIGCDGKRAAAVAHSDAVKRELSKP